MSGLNCSSKMRISDWRDTFSRTCRCCQAQIHDRSEQRLRDRALKWPPLTRLKLSGSTRPRQLNSFQPAGFSELGRLIAARRTPQAATNLELTIDRPRALYHIAPSRSWPSVLQPAIIDRAHSRAQEAPREMLLYGDFDTTMEVVARAVTAGPFLLGDQFTVADMVIGSTLRWTMLFNLVPTRPEFTAYVARFATAAQARAGEGRGDQGTARLTERCRHRGQMRADRPRRAVRGGVRACPPTAAVRLSSHVGDLQLFSDPPFDPEAGRTLFDGDVERVARRAFITRWAQPETIDRRVG